MLPHLDDHHTATSRLIKSMSAQREDFLSDELPEKRDEREHTVERPANQPDDEEGFSATFPTVHTCPYASLRILFHVALHVFAGLFRVEDILERYLRLRLVIRVTCRYH